jgi:geranylgeranyl reductase family protein
VQGLRTLVVDKAVFPRDKTCGDGLTTSALRQLERAGVRLPELPAYTAVRDVVLVAPGGRRVALTLPDDGHHSAVIPRRDLDTALVARARELGVDVKEGASLATLSAHDGGLRGALGDGSIVDARFVVAADGHWSHVRRLRAPDAPTDLGTWHAVRQYFGNVEDRRQWVFFEPDLLPGYAWVFPLPGGRANVGFGVLRDGGHRGAELKALWTDLLARPMVRSVLGPRATPEDRSRAWPIPTTFDPSRLADGRILYAGDAAGVVDPMTGEGIAQALESGALAAGAIAAGGSPAVVGARYRHAVERGLGRDLRFAAALQRVLRSPLGARAALRLVGLTAWTRRNFARWMFEDYPRAALLTPDRWARGLFAPPGAFRGAH